MIVSRFDAFNLRPRRLNWLWCWRRRRVNRCFYFRFTVFSNAGFVRLYSGAHSEKC